MANKYQKYDNKNIKNKNLLKILVSSRTGFSNKGDEAIFSTMINLFKSIQLNIEILSVSTHPKITTKVHSVRSIWNMNVLKELWVIKDCDIVVIGGGGLLQDIYSKTTIPAYLHTVFLAKLLKKPVVYYALGVGAIKNRIGRKITKLASKEVDKITVRDEESKKNLVDLNITTPIQILRDPVFFLNAANKNRIDEVLNHEGIKKSKKPLFALSVRQKNLDVEVIANAMDIIVDKLNTDIILIPMDPKKDIPLAENISNKMKHSSYFLKGDYNPQELLGIIGCVDLMIGMRFHSLVMAAIMGVPMVGIEYEPKIKSFSSYMNLPKPIPVENISAENLLNQVEYVWNNRQNISKKNSKTIELFRKEIFELTKEVLNYKDKKIKIQNKFDFIVLMFLLVISYFYNIVDYFFKKF